MYPVNENTGMPDIPPAVRRKWVASQPRSRSGQWVQRMPNPLRVDRRTVRRPPAPPGMRPATRLVPTRRVRVSGRPRRKNNGWLDMWHDLLRLARYIRHPYRWWRHKRVKELKRRARVNRRLDEHVWPEVESAGSDTPIWRE